MKTLHNILKISILASFIFVLTNSADAQQEAMFTQYMFNTASVNPAYVGSLPVMNVMYLGRKQWVGFEGSPTTQTLNLHVPIKAQKIATGISFMNDRIGPVQENTLFLNFSYALKLTEKTHLSFGLNAGGKLFQIKLSEIAVIDSRDVSFSEDKKSKFMPNFGFGTFLFSERYYLGLSFPKLVKNTFNFNEGESATNLTKQERHFFMIGGYVFPLSANIMFKPSFQLKYVYGVPLSVDLTGSFLIKEKIWLGASYRIGDALGFTIQYKAFDSLWIGYAFDYSASIIRRYNTGTHEIMISYDFDLGRERMKSPRYF